MVEEAITDLAVVFPPPRPKKTDVRHQNFEGALARHGSGNCGVYNFARWVPIRQTGVKDPGMSGDLISGGANHIGVYLFHMKISRLIQIVSLFFPTVEPQMHLHYLEQYRYVCMFSYKCI